MTFTIFSLFIAVVWVSAFAKIASLLRKQMLFMRYFSIYPLLFILLFCILRLVISIELPYTKIINSVKILPALQAILCTPIIYLGSHGLSLFQILLTIWISGAFVILIRHVREYYHLRSVLNLLPASNDMHLYDMLSKLNIQGRLLNTKIIVNDSIESPAIIGFFKPIILLPNIKFTDNELLGIYTHEYAHYHYGHFFIKCITEVIRSFFWWNPFFKEFSLEITHVLELHSDKVVCRLLGAEIQEEYLLGIAKVIDHLGNQTAPISAFSCSLVEESDGEKIKQRFRMILEKNYNNKKRGNILILPIICLLFLISYGFVIQPYSEPDIGSYGDMEEINVDSYLVKSKNGYELYDASDNFIAKIEYIDENLSNLKIIDESEDN